MKRHFNAAPLSSDRFIVEKAREMSDMYECHVMRELGIGQYRLRRLMKEYGLVFRRREIVGRPREQARPMRTREDRLMAGRAVLHEGSWYKRCSICENVLEANKFCFDDSKTSGLKSHCRECGNAREREYYKAKKSKLSSREDGVLAGGGQ